MAAMMGTDSKFIGDNAKSDEEPSMTSGPGFQKKILLSDALEFFLYNFIYHQGLCLKVLNSNNSSPVVSDLIIWMKACFEALERKYVRDL
ncbi:hypothetical protein TrispH2_000914 [Trichoplax sp. H2]|nr:hypothetical protein TrispH2_000914 [Trichoplax sp. H2]|eukprot:RDD46655.1 hypothetical protein TrispH2_000914 [Trichoplax sp. H2]